MRAAIWTLLFMTVLQAPGWSQDPGDEIFRINTFTEGQQKRPAVAVAPDGSFVTVWSSDGQDGDYWGIFGQRFAKDGSKVGPEFQVNTSTVNGQDLPAIASDIDANFVVVWTSGHLGGGQYGIFGRRFSADGAPLGPEFKVNTSSDYLAIGPRVSSAAAGDFVVVWWDLVQSAVLGQRFDSAGSKLGGEFDLGTSSAYLSPSVASDASGNFVVAWSEAASYQTSIRGQRFDADGAPQGAPIHIEPDEPFHHFLYPEVASNALGAFVVAWNEQEAYIFARGLGTSWQAFDSTGAPRGEIGNFGPDDEAGGAPTTTWLDDERFVVAADRVVDGSSSLVALRRDGSGGRSGFRFAVDEGYRGYVGSDADGSGDFVVVWNSSYASGSDIFGRRMKLGLLGCPTTVALKGEPDERRILDTLYALRDEIMARSPQGRAYIRLFYRHAGEGAILLARHEELRASARKLLRRLNPKLEAAAHGRLIRITRDEITAIDELMNAFSGHASNGLKETIRGLRDRLREGTLLSILGDGRPPRG